jgi:hypothetical protein
MLARDRTTERSVRRIDHKTAFMPTEVSTVVTGNFNDYGVDGVLVGTAFDMVYETQYN